MTEGSNLSDSRLLFVPILKADAISLTNFDEPYLTSLAFSRDTTCRSSPQYSLYTLSLCPRPADSIGVPPFDTLSNIYMPLGSQG